MSSSRCPTPRFRSRSPTEAAGARRGLARRWARRVGARRLGPGGWSAPGWVFGLVNGGLAESGGARALRVRRAHLMVSQRAIASRLSPRGASASGAACAPHGEPARDRVPAQPGDDQQRAIDQATLSTRDPDHLADTRAENPFRCPNPDRVSRFVTRRGYRPSKRTFRRPGMGNVRTGGLHTT